jgi:signal transduction histidine kinase
VKDSGVGDRAGRVDEVLDEQRARVLRFVRPVATWCVIPVLLVLTVNAVLADGPLLLVSFQTVVAIAITVQLWRLRDDNVSSVSFSMNIGFALICGAAFVGYGPLLGTGMMMLAWLFSMAFFHGHIVVPVVLCTASVFVIGMMREVGVIEPAWAKLDGGAVAWVRMTITTGVMATAATYLLRRVLSGLSQALMAEADAREQQARAQEEREASLQALAKAQRLESVGRLAGGVAHDVNNALTVLMGGLELLDEDLDEPTRRLLLSDMDTAAQGALATTRQLLSFARTRAAVGEHADPVISIRALGRSVQRLLPAHIHVELDLATETQMIPMSAGSLEQVVLNLCINARDAMASGGVLTLRCIPHGDGEVLIEVKDDGEGMEPEVAERVFEPFFTTKAAHRGTGLGLSMAKDMVEKVGGRIEVESREHEGTSVRLLFPVVERAQSASTVGEHRTRGRGRRERVLLLDDEPAVRHTLERILSRADFEVHSVATVDDAMKCVDDPGFDALITDEAHRGRSSCTRGTWAMKTCSASWI